MPDPCVLELGLNGDAPDAAGIPTRLGPYARVSGPCAQIRISIRQSDGGAVLFSAVAAPDSNGTAAVEFPVDPPVFPCGFRMWVEAECVAGGSCHKAVSIPIACKGRPSGNGDGGGSDGWPWPLPPQLFCPLIGRTFTTAVLFGLLSIVVGAALGVTPGIAAGFAVIAGAFAVLAIWRVWCAPHHCYLWGALLWALKRAFIGGLLVSLVSLSIGGFLVCFAMGAAAGVITGRLRQSRCQLPGLSTPLNQLPLW
jgi:hypothetical protein